MPTISRFYGILIQMFWGDHAPPHFHVKYADDKAVIEIKTLKVTSGKLPPQAYRLVKLWAKQHKEELFKDWELCSEDTPPKKIDPLK